MKKGIIIILLVLFVVCLWIWSPRTPPADQAIAEFSGFETNQPAASSLTQPPRSAVSEPTPESDPVSWTEKRLKQMEAAREDSLNEWRTPIEFYGKVVDEAENPVAGAQVAFSCNDVSLSGTSKYQAVSDGQGLFSITGITGKLLTAYVSKEGYYSSGQDNNSFYYAGQNENFVPDANNPVVFHLRKKGGAEPLIATGFPGGAKIVQLRRDGSTVEIDLIKGAIVPIGSGQLKLEFLGDPIEKGKRTFDWKCRLSVEGGGLIQTDDEFDFKAPEKGYEPTCEIEMLSGDEKWQTETKRKFFIKLPSGKFGRIEFYLLARNGVYTIQSFINPSGSRNLEYDEKVQPKPAQFE
jgi:hypothetical protein